MNDLTDYDEGVLDAHAEDAQYLEMLTNSNYRLWEEQNRQDRRLKWALGYGALMSVLAIVGWLAALAGSWAL